MMQGTPTLTEKKDVLTSLWHWTVSCSTYKDRAVHLSSTSDHVFNVVGVAWAVNDVRSDELENRILACDVLIVIPRAFSSGAESICE